MKIIASRNTVLVGEGLRHRFVNAHVALLFLRDMCLHVLLEAGLQYVRFVFVWGWMLMFHMHQIVVLPDGGELARLERSAEDAVNRNIGARGRT